MKAQLDSISASAERFWAARNHRERIALGLAASVLLVTLYSLSISALQQRIERLERRLPELLLNSYEIAAGSQNSPTAAPSSADLRSDLFKILADRGLQAELRALGTSQVEMRLPAQEARALINNLNTLRLTAGARVSSLQLRSLDDDQGTEATAILERSR